MKMTTEQATELFRHHGLQVEQVNYKGFTVNMIKPSDELAQHWQARHEINAVAIRIGDAIAAIDDEIASLKAKVGIAS